MCILNAISEPWLLSKPVYCENLACVQGLSHNLTLCSHTIDSAIDSPQLPHFNAKGPLCLSPSFQMSTLSLPGQAPSPLQSPILNEVATARLDEEEEGRRKVYNSHANLLRLESVFLFCFLTRFIVWV